MRRKRNFNGCWSCRKRKVKCDMNRPKCSRCIKSGINCEGYDIKLSFYQSLIVKDGKLVDLIKTQEASKYHRRSVEFSKFPRHEYYETYEKLNNVVDGINDEKLQGMDELKIGPFAVYLYGLNFVGPESIEPRDEPMEQLIDPIDNEELGDKLKIKQNLIHSDLLKFARLSIYGIKGNHYKINDQNIYHILYPTYYPNIDSDDWEPINYYNKLIETNNNGSTILTKNYKLLILGFNNLEFSFIKLNFKDPWTLKILPYLNTIIFENIIHLRGRHGSNYESKVNGGVHNNNNVGGHSNVTYFNDNNDDDNDDDNNDDNDNEVNAGDDNENDIYDNDDNDDNDDQNYHKDDSDALIEKLKTIINYLIISLSCFNLSQKGEDIDEYLKISIHLRKMGLNLLNYHLDEYDSNVDLNNDEYNLLLLICIILQIEIDNYFNIYENFELLFSIGEFIINQDNEDLTLENEKLIIFTIFKIMYTFFISTQNIDEHKFQISDKDMEKYRDLRDDYDLSKFDRFENPVVINNVEFDRLLDQANSIDNSELIDKTDYNNYHDDNLFKPGKTNRLCENEIYLMFGIPKSLIMLFSEIINLTNHKRIFKIQGKFPRNFPKICSEIEEKLNNWKCHWMLDASNFHKIIDLNIAIFYNCLKIYYNRLIKNEVHQHLINKVINLVNELSILNAAEGGAAIKLPYWIMVIINCDNHNNYGVDDTLFKFQNLTHWRSKQMMIEIYNRRSTEPTSWMELIREWDIVLYLG